MKILAIGDFHGKFPVKLRKLVESVDVVVSAGDYPSWSFKDLFFECCYRTNKELWDIVGKKKYKDGFVKDWKTGENILEQLNSFKVPVFSVVGNYDHHNVSDSFDEGKIGWKWAGQDFFLRQLKNIRTFEDLIIGRLELEMLS